MVRRARPLRAFGCAPLRLLEYVTARNLHEIRSGLSLQSGPAPAGRAADRGGVKVIAAVNAGPKHENDGPCDQRQYDHRGRCRLHFNGNKIVSYGMTLMASTCLNECGQAGLRRPLP